MGDGLTIDKTMRIIQRGSRDKKNILGILIDLQFASGGGYIDQETAALVAGELGMTETRVYELLGYYAMLKTKPQAQHVLKICNSSPCHFSKADEIMEMLILKLGVQIGETTPDGVFAFHYIPCVGACEIGPIIKVKDTVFGNLTEEKVGQLLEDLRTGRLLV